MKLIFLLGFVLLCGVVFCEEDEQEDGALVEFDDAVREDDAVESEDQKMTTHSKKQTKPTQENTKRKKTQRPTTPSNKQCRVVKRWKCGQRCMYVSYKQKCSQQKGCSKGGRKRRVCFRQCRLAKQRQCRRVYQKTVCKKSCRHQRRCPTKCYRQTVKGPYYNVGKPYY